MRTIFSNMLFSAASVTLTAGLVDYADPALANVPQTAAPQARVAYGDLDLHSAQGRATLDRRIRGAAEQVCAGSDGSDRIASATCRLQAVAGARRSVDAVIADAGTPAVPGAAN